MAGATLTHPHIQLIATPVTPRAISVELESARAHFHLKERCLFCDLLAQEIDQIHTHSRNTYGAPRVEKELRKKGRCHGRNRVARLMKQKGLCGRQKGRYRVRTTDSNHDQPIAPNRLAEAPKATAPNQIWVADITYIQTQEGWLYLAAILDLYSRKIVGWAMGPSRQPPDQGLTRRDR